MKRNTKVTGLCIQIYAFRFLHALLKAYTRHPYHLLKVIGQCMCLWHIIKYGDNLYDMQASLLLKLPLDEELAQFFYIL